MNLIQGLTIILLLASTVLHTMQGNGLMSRKALDIALIPLLIVVVALCLICVAQALD